MVPPGREIILGVCGGISAYKSADLLRRLQDEGFLITVIPTQASVNFVGVATWEALSGREVPTNLWNNISSVPHIQLAQRASLMVIAPATADFLGKMAHGLADDLLSSTYAAMRAPVIVVPAMHPEMWHAPATVENVRMLRSFGVTVIDPEFGRMTGSDIGQGRYPETSVIVERVKEVLSHKADLKGYRVLISAGGTREPIDAVRFIGNHSSGKQGHALALAAAYRGAEVELVMANSELPILEGVTTVQAKTAAAMYEEMTRRVTNADLVIMSAAVADVRPALADTNKISKEHLTSIDVVRNPDIIAELGKTKRGNQVFIGFAAETGVGGLERAHVKIRSKNLDLLYFNDVSGGAIFNQDETEGYLLDSDGTEIRIPRISKELLAHQLLDVAASKLGRS
jgi:phosphopantothenoylcysteine decarboxylase / phosphopantothenate---cysteine ligase